jgi:hypothetical protein
MVDHHSQFTTHLWDGYLLLTAASKEQSLLFAHIVALAPIESRENYNSTSTIFKR